VNEVVTNRLSKWFTSLGFTLRRTYAKISTAKPSIFVVAAVITGFSLFLLAGGVYDILEQPLAAIPFGRSVLFFYPYTLQAQAVIESIGVMIAYALGVVGILLMYQSTKYAYKPRQAFMMLLSGVILILIAYFYVENLVFSKLFPPSQTSTTSGG
jgi:hypothetical protein